MCHTEHQVKECKYSYGNDQKNFLPTLEHVAKYYAEWVDQFSNGPYQDKLMELNCERIWANIGDVLLQTKYADRQIKNVEVHKEYIRNPLCKKDV